MTERAGALQPAVLEGTQVNLRSETAAAAVLTRHVSTHALGWHWLAGSVAGSVAGPGRGA